MASLELIEDQQKQRFMTARLGANSATKDDLNLMTVSKIIQSKQSDSDSKDITSTVLPHQSSQIEELQLENSKLKVALNKTQKELETVMATSKDEQQAFTGGGCGKSSVVGKVVELSRKNRALSAELASEQNKVKQLENKLKELTAEQLQQSNTQHVSAANSSLPSSDCEDQVIKRIASLEEQLKEALAKTTEYRNQCEMVKQELKVVLKVLAREVGEGVSVSSLLGANTNWKGRAQQIIVLQNKVMELKQQLKQSAGSSTSTVKLPQSSAGDRQACALKKIELKKQQALESVATQLESLKEEHSHLEQQYSALKARNKYLTTELKQTKQQMSSLRNESKQNDLLILKLRQKQETEQLNCTTSTEKLNSNHLLHQQQLEQLLHRRDVEIKELKKQIRQSSAPPAATMARASSTSISTASSVLHRTLSVPETEKLTTQLHVLSVERDKLMELVACMQDRMDEAFSVAAKYQADLQIQRRKNVLQEKQLMCHQGKLKNNESNVADLENELAIQKDENKVLKECLIDLRQDRQKDTKMMHDLLLHSRELYLESINRITQKSSS